MGRSAQQEIEDRVSRECVHLAQRLRSAAEHIERRGNEPRASLREPQYLDWWSVVRDVAHEMSAMVGNTSLEGLIRAAEEADRAQRGEGR